jgi:hypothetical protein
MVADSNRPVAQRSMGEGEGRGVTIIGFMRANFGCRVSPVPDYQPEFEAAAWARNAAFGEC